MADSSDFFAGFESRYVETEAGRIFVRFAGNGPPLALIHGFPQTGVMWHRLAPTLAQRFAVVIPDLRGYGWSSAPSSQNGDSYTKRAMGADVVSVMEALGHVRFAVAGHDRGARIGYRLALDHPGRLSKLALLDILPTMEVWRAIEKDGATAPHWRFLATPEPKPERVIGDDPDAYYLGLMRLWSKGKTLHAFDPRALDAYKSGWGDPSRVHAACEDYRAGARQDREADEADAAAGKTIAVPVQVLASTEYLGKAGEEPPLAIWRRTFAPGATGEMIDSGHFLAEENPAATLAALSRFLGST